MSSLDTGNELSRGNRLLLLEMHVSLIGNKPNRERESKGQDKDIKVTQCITFLHGYS